jgi:glyoxylase-like metal-dependent hydrolase (beta-lactamase superfamily II)
MPLDVKTPGGSYPEELLASLERIASRDVATIYAGHAGPLTSGVPELLMRTIRNVRQSAISYSGPAGASGTIIHPARVGAISLPALEGS